MIIQNPGDPLPCPHCDKPQEDPAKDHLVPNKPLIQQTYDCVHCDEYFTVVGNTDGSITVEKA